MGACTKNRDGESLMGFFEEFVAVFFFLVVIFLDRMRSRSNGGNISEGNDDL